jgi:hypothetical protein
MLDEAVGSGNSSLGRELALGFGYWFAFLLILQPGNVLSSRASRHPAALFSGAVSHRRCEPAWRGHHAPPSGVDAPLSRWKGRTDGGHALIHATCIICLSVVLIGVAQVLAAWLLTGRDPRLQAPLDRQLVANAPLLILCMSSLVAGVHALIFWRRAEQEGVLLAHARNQLSQAEAAPPEVYLTTVPVKTRGRTLLLAVADIDWVETQGNYLALHVGPATHLIRETLANFESSLDPGKFCAYSSHDAGCERSRPGNRSTLQRRRVRTTTRRDSAPA